MYTLYTIHYIYSIANLPFDSTSVIMNFKLMASINTREVRDVCCVKICTDTELSYWLYIHAGENL